MVKKKVIDFNTTVSDKGFLNMGKIRLNGLNGKTVRLMVFADEADIMPVAKPGIDATGRLTRVRDDDPYPCTGCHRKCPDNPKCDLFREWFERKVYHEG